MADYPADRAAMVMITSELREQARALCEANGLTSLQVLLTVLCNAYATEVANTVLAGLIPAEDAITMARESIGPAIRVMLKPATKGGH